MTIEKLRIESWFRGPARSGHGGYVGGLVGAGLPAERPAQVRLRMPPPLDTDLELVDIDGSVALRGPDGSVIATGTSVQPDVLAEATVDPAGPAETRAAEAAYAAMSEHPFSTCYGCGPDNEHGLRLQPGMVDQRRTACGWLPAASTAGPDGLVAIPHLWAALDCPGGWTIVQNGGRTSILGQLTVQIDTRPAPGEPCLVMGQWLGEDGRKTFAATTLYGPTGQVLAQSHQIWLAIDPAVFN